MHIKIRQAGALAYFRPAFMHIFFTGLFAAGWTHSTNAQPQLRCEPWAAKLVTLEGEAEWRAKGESRWRTVKPPLIFCVGDSLKVRDSRATLRLPNDTVVRLKEKTTLNFVAPRESFLLELLHGAAHFITRTPRRLEVKTPYLNAAVDGTEFLVAAVEKNHRVAVFEGQVSVSSQWGTTALNSGEQVSVDSASAPHAPVRIKLRDSVAWALYYPPIVVPESTPPDIKQAFDKGQITKAAERLSEIEDREKTADDYSLLAALGLYRGKTEEARKHIDKARALAADNPTALALQSIMLLVAGHPQQALASAEALVVRRPQLASPYLALSYAQQSQFQLPAALASAEKAVELQPENGLLHARLAELALMLGDQARANRHGELAVKFSPGLSRTHSILGFAALNRLALSAAKNSFARAAQLDPADPLPQLGLGLISIRRGDLEAGREKIELAVALDPGSALLRSYLGKAYYEEKRNALAGPQYSLARELDPDDPTPWFYQALRRQSDNELLLALKDLDKAIELNDNRAVYRSRLLLDKDAAARSASQARIYTAIGFDQLAVLQGADAVAQAPQEHSGHRLLAQAYADRPRFETLRASERLQARLLQPLGAQPLPLGLGEPGLLVQPGAGPNDLGLNEFNSLFVKEGVSGHASILLGSQNTEAFDWHIGGLGDSGAFELGQYQYSSDGFRENNDVNYTLHSLFGQQHISDALTVQIELKRRKDKQGDLVQRFFTENFSTNLHTDTKTDSNRIGFNYQTSTSSRLLGTFINKDIEEKIIDKRTSNPFLILNVDLQFDVKTEQTELQYLLDLDNHNWLFGAIYFDGRRQIVDSSNFVSSPPLPPFPPSLPRRSSPVDLHKNTYIYTSLHPLNKTFKTTMGISYTDFDGEFGSDHHWNPKLGLTWLPTDNLQFRAAVFQTLKAPFQLTESLEPTHLAGFPQVFDDANSSFSKFKGLGFDYNTAKGIRTGIDFGEREVKQPGINNVTLTFETTKTTETTTNFYFYHPLNDQWGLSAELNLENARRAHEDIFAVNTPAKLKTYRLPLRASYFLTSRSTLLLTANYVKQAVEFSLNDDILGPNDSFISENSDFWTFDLEFNYRFPNRWGVISLETRNLLDKEFKYQDINFQTNTSRPQLIVPERTLLGSLTFYF